MIGGQVLDLQNEKNPVFTKEVLYSIYKNKTGKLLTAPLLIASTLADNKYFAELNDFGYNLGYLFQIIDDIMDVECNFESIGKTPNKDEKENKLTSIKLFGLDGAKKRAEFHYNKCLESLKDVQNADFLVDFAKAMYIRRK
jgi:geranylgeranyl pyrophosphate synthase